MFSYLIDVVIILLLLFAGIKFIKTREYDDKKDLYTDESKEKAALICGVMCIIAAVAVGVISFLQYNGTMSAVFGEGALASFLPFGIVFALVVIVLIYIYAAVLKKK